MTDEQQTPQQKRELKAAILARMEAEVIAAKSPPPTKGDEEVVTKEPLLPLSPLVQKVNEHLAEGRELEERHKSYIPQSVRERPALPQSRELHPNLDLFISELFSPRSDIQSMEHPVYSLNIRRPKNEGQEIRTYEHNGDFLEIRSPIGIATQLDKDIIIVCASHIMGQINEGIEPSRTVLVRPYDLLVSVNRGTSGKDYGRLREALKRLHSTTITTNIKTGRRRVYKAFHLIENWQHDDGKDEAGEDLSITPGALKITISEWLFSAITQKEVISLPRYYFHMKSPLQRRVWELCKKHLGKQKEWKVRLSVFHKKTGFSGPKRNLKAKLKEMVAEDSPSRLPDFSITIQEKPSQKHEDILIVARL